MSIPSIIVGQSNWAVKPGNFLGYANSQERFVPREFAVTRALDTATRINSSGNIELVPANVPRVDFLGGQRSLLVEPSGTNSIRNNSMVGAVTGTPGTLPTNYITALAGLTRTIVGTGTENGVAYMDIRFSGTSTGGAVVIQEETSTSITAASGQVWTHSVYAKVIANVLNMPSIRVGMYELTSLGFYLTEGSNPVILTSSLNRFSFTRTLSNASTARVLPIVQWIVNNGVSYDFTVRIGYPQMETGSVATSVIPTTTGTVTRNADVVSVTGVAGLIGQTEGTIYVDINRRDNSTPNRRILSIGTGSNFDNRIEIVCGGTGNANKITCAMATSGVTQFSQQSSADFLGDVKAALSYSSAGFSFYVNGNVIASGTTAITPPIVNSIGLGQIWNTAILSNVAFNDRIRAASIYQTRLPNTTTDGSPSLQSITTL